MSKENDFCKYLLKNVENEFTKKGYVTFKNKKKNIFDVKFTGNGKCFKQNLEKMFQTKISCSLYDSVVNGEGNEKEKINSIYSSSLQSLLFFHNVNEHNPLKIVIGGKNLEFTKVYFEHKNKVIGYASSIDVVLVNKKRQILFIESKLFEIIRDSYSKDNYEQHRVVGVSYLSDKEGSYNRVFGITKQNVNELINLGINIDKNRFPYKEPLNKDDAAHIKPFGENNYVYSEGVKQVLSHLIGIKNFIDKKYCPSCEAHLRTDFKEVYFIELYNALPDFESRDQIECFKKHIEAIFSKDSGIVPSEITCQLMTYQELYKTAKDNLDDPDKIMAKFYHLED